MTKEAFVFEVGEQSFAKYVLQNSNKIPAVVEFMGVWSEPCAAMADVFSKLANEFPEQFIFAKVDIDEQPELREQYKIENVPTIIVFKDGEEARTEVGQLQEAEARSLLKEFGVYHESDLLREQARNKHLSGDTAAAIMLLTEAIQIDPGNTRVVMDMVQVFIDMGELVQARDLFNKLPERVSQTDMGKSLNGRLLFADLAAKTPGPEVLNQQLSIDESNHAARFDMAICLVDKYQYEDALTQLFYILERDAEFKDGAVKEMIVVITNMLASVDAELAKEFRRRLSNTLSS